MFMAFWKSLSFQNLISVMNSELEKLHDLVMVWLFVIILIVLFISYKVFIFNYLSALNLDSVTLEVTWTLLPMLILVTIAFPSIHLLCTQDVVFMVPKNTVKVLSNQWNWQSEQLEVMDHLLDSDSLDELGSFEYPLLFSSNESIRVMLTSSDVLHSLGVPSLGLKLDSSPGRLNSVTFESSNPSLLVGSCYELCGSGHSAMPIYWLCV